VLLIPLSHHWQYYSYLQVIATSAIQAFKLSQAVLFVPSVITSSAIHACQVIAGSAIHALPIIAGSAIHALPNQCYSCLVNSSLAVLLMPCQVITGSGIHTFKLSLAVLATPSGHRRQCCQPIAGSASTILCYRWLSSA